MRFLFLAISRSIRGLCKEKFRQRFFAEKRSPRLSDAEGRILLPKFSVCEKGRPLDFLSSCARCALILQQQPRYAKQRVYDFSILGDCPSWLHLKSRKYTALFWGHNLRFESRASLS